MKKLKHLILALCSGGFLIPISAQTEQKPLSVDDLAAWQRISSQAISDNGQWVACKMEPWKGDATLYLYNVKGEEKKRFSEAAHYQFAASSNYLVLSQSPRQVLMDSLKLKKQKKDKMPMDRLHIHAMQGETETIDSLRSFQMAKKADWIAYQRGRNDSTLYVRSLDGKTTFEFPEVTHFQFAPESSTLYYISKNAAQPGLFTLCPEQGKSNLIKEGKGQFKQTVFDKQGHHIAFLYCADKDSSYKAMSLWLSEQNGPAQEIVARGNQALPADWVISKHGSLHFSSKATRLFFGTSPEPRQKDTTLLAKDRPDVQVWSWNEPVQYTVQQYNQAKELKRSYQAVYHLATGKTVQLADKDLPNIQLGDEGEAAYALLSTSRPYSLSSMWEGRSRSDYYLVSLEKGERTLLSKADYAHYRLSPGGQYAYGYNETDSCWYSFSLPGGERHQLTTPATFAAWDEENDTPNYPSAYGAAGWSANDKQLLIYDRYDLWSIDPTGQSAPINLTVDGRKSKRSYRYVRLNPEERTIDLNQPLLLKGFDEISKGNGYYQAKLTTPKAPKQLMGGNYMLNSLVKAANSNQVVFSKETFEQYPDLYCNTLDFKKSTRLTYGDQQQKQFRWGTAELVSWTSLDGKKIEGVVYKPADFDPNKKYPLIVSFYERNAETLHKYRMPEPHRSTIDYHLYNSQGYVVFNPDIHYTDGYPGESCYNCLMPGVAMLIAEGYIDEKAIGAQGHSWGGYQVAYLATRTKLFAAIESGAPVVNMFSAYGGIRWGSGLARSFQYEHTQSRLGGTPWDAPLRYQVNSPLFTMDKVETPILIMHNDSDGHVPWYQGIEYFVAMKRLGKPCWMLNYPGEPHWPMKIANKIDFQKRMLQFFNHYLKHEAAPKWMTEGVPAADQPFELGY